MFLTIFFVILWLNIISTLCHIFFWWTLMFYLRIYSFWIYVLVHEIWHWLAYLCFWKIDNIRMSFTKKDSIENWSLWQCSWFIGNKTWRLWRSIISYFWELTTILLTFLCWYLFWIWKINIIFYIFSWIFLLYFIYWRTALDKIVWFTLMIFFFALDNEFIRQNDKWLLDFLDWRNLELIKEFISVVLLSSLISWSIVNILKLTIEFFYSKNNESDPSSLSSDAWQIQKELWIPKIITYSSWIFLLVITLSLNYSMIFWKKTWNEWIDKKVYEIEKFIKFERNEKEIEKMMNKNYIEWIKEVKK